MTADELVARTIEVLSAVPYVILGTADGTNVSLRQVQPIEIEDDLTMWVGTSRRSRKANEIAATGSATVAVEHFAEATYVSLICTAELIDDLETRVSKWVPELGVFFPDGADGDDLVLIRLTPHRIEVMDFTNNITPAPFGLVPAAAQRTEAGWTAVPHPRHPEEGTA